MKIMAFDTSKSSTGWAFLEIMFRNGALADLRGVSAMRCGSFKSVGDTFFDTIWDFHPKFLKLIKEFRPDYVIVEEGLAVIPQFEVTKKLLTGEEVKRLVVNANSSLVLQRILGDVQAILRGMSIPHETVAVETWRKTFLGYGRKKGMTQDAYKKAARAQCEALGINVSNNDQAEAAGILYWGAVDSQHIKEIVNKQVAA
jgi:hypothetical protein